MNKGSSINWARFILFALVVASVVAACATIPITGRRSLNIIPEGQELALGADSYRQVLAESELVTSGPELEMVRRVGQRIAVISYKPNYEWEFNLVRDDEMANAFCLPGGKVAVYTGILPVTQNETGLAAVMAHEVAHAIARHGGERMTDQLAFQLGGMTLESLLSEKSERTRNLLLTAYGVGSTLGILLPFSRAQESEADHIGLVYMAKAGYDPHEAIAFWERMDRQAGGAAPPEWLSTHPSHSTRVQDIRGWLPEAMKHYKPAQ